MVDSAPLRDRPTLGAVAKRAGVSKTTASFVLTGRDVLDYIHTLYEAVCDPAARDVANVTKMKRYMNFIGAGLEQSDAFLHGIRRSTMRTEFFAICTEHLDHSQAMTLSQSAGAAKSPAPGTASL